MNCLSVRERLPEHALGTLPASDRTPVDEHLAWCAACRKEAGELERAAATLAYAAAPVDPPADLEERVVRAVRGAAGERGWGAAPRRRRGAAALLAAAIALSGLGWGAVMAGRADRIRDQMAATQLHQRIAQRNFATVLKELEGADPANIVEIADLTSSRKGASGQALVLLSPTTDDLVFVVVSGLTDLREERFPLQVRLVSGDAGELVAGTIKALDTGGGGGLSRFFVEDLQAFDGIVVRDAHGKVLLHGSLGVHQPTP